MTCDIVCVCAQAKLAKYNSELMSMKSTLQRYSRECIYRQVRIMYVSHYCREQELSSRLRESSPIGEHLTLQYQRIMNIFVDTGLVGSNGRSDTGIFLLVSHCSVELFNVCVEC